MRRREFLKNAAALASAGPLAAQSTAGKRARLAYVGTYSSPQGPEGSKGSWRRHLFVRQWIPQPARLSQRDGFPNSDNPSWLAFDPSRTHLYSANETTTFQGIDSGLGERVRGRSAQRAI